MSKAANSSQLPPGPKPTISLVNLLRFRRDSLGFLSKLAGQYGDIVHFKIGPLRVVYLNHPDYIKEVLSKQHSNFVKGRPLEMAKVLLGEGLLTSEGEFHKRQSRIIQPAFHRRMMGIYAPAMTAYATRLMNGWEDGMRVDVMREMMKMSTGIAGKTMFNVDIEEEAPEIDQALESIMSLFGRITLPFAELLLKLPLPGTLRFFRAKAQLDKTIYRIIAERRRSMLNNGDLLSLLLQEQGETDGGGLSDQSIRDEALTLFLTAFDTTSIALTWTWYLLSQHPEVEADLHKELDSVLQGRLPTLDDYPQLKFTRMIFTESMRMYPPIYIIARQALEQFAIGNYVVPGGTIVLMSPYLIHRDSRFHPDPQQFNPYSWAQRPDGHYPKFEYFPFSEGPRSCIGQHYAWLEGILVLASIAQFWRMTLVPDHSVEMAQLLNLRPKHGMMMQLHRRK
ncbi:cytochrome P450 [Pontibacter diazotrophicus]|uniref:Cytochrome P450 n=1 Tax=Pontibacter diazotrophicus TaxID=1400979 RepID=A0A3D8LD93_9BACT|nr:cytochrome P450 [Pontibacter diazotrophicus]RDV15367.1 cytochrome P450 [Pontibacter diazotrophicus]